VDGERRWIFDVDHEKNTWRMEMPVRKTKGGYKYGNKGKLYKGKGAKKKAQKQGKAIQASKRARTLGHD